MLLTYSLVRITYVGAPESIVAVIGDSFNPAVDTRGVAELRVKLTVAHASLPLHLPLRLQQPLVKHMRSIEVLGTHHLGLHDLLMDNARVVQRSGLGLIDSLLPGMTNSGQQAESDDAQDRVRRCHGCSIGTLQDSEMVYQRVGTKRRDRQSMLIIYLQ